MLTLNAYLTEVARAYDRAPRLAMRDVHAWSILADETMALFEQVAQAITVYKVAQSDPYATAVDMFRDIAHGFILVADVNHDHPVWSPEVNRAFRVVHDVVGHATTGSGFDWAGELRAWERHESTVSDPRARQALFTEAVGQVAWMLHPAYGKGAFGPQKVATLPFWLSHEDIVQGVAA